MSEEERLTLLRLTEQVQKISSKLEELNQSVRRGENVNPPSHGISRQELGIEENHLTPKSKSKLPSSYYIRKIIRERHARARFFDGDLFADPAWEILLELTASHIEKSKVSVTSLCMAAGVPPTSGLRWIGQMSDAGLLLRYEDEKDKRRAFITLSDKALSAMAQYFHEIGVES